ncbi:MAG TPA: Calx-beta domain-containing protein [Pseudomonadales bacterium]
MKNGLPARLPALLLPLMLLLGSCSGSDSGTSSPPPLPQLEMADRLYDESATPIILHVTLSAAAPRDASVDYQLLDGTATANSDFVPASGTLLFPQGSSQAQISLQLIDDDIAEATEYFYLRFSSPAGLQLASEQITITIAANDGGGWTPMTEFDPHWGTIGAFTDAASCGRCHSAATDSSGVLRYPKQADGDDIGFYTLWKHTPMGHSFDDPYFQAKVQDETKQLPQLAGTIEDKCLTCHSPMAHNHAHRTGLNLDTNACLSVDGCYRMDTAHQDMMAREGISCTLCHQVDPANLGQQFSGGFVIDNDALAIYGPYLNPVTQPMANNTQYTVKGGAHIQASALCAVCHDLKTPSVDINTNQLTGTEFVEQSPYAEWLNSEFADDDDDDSKPCQDCHMPVIDDYSSQIATQPSGSANLNWPARDDISQHVFLGGNNYLLTLLKTFRDELGIADSTSEAGFDRQMAMNSAFLTEKTAELFIDDINLAGDQLDIAVRIINKAGHKLPTSYPSRRVWLNLLVRDGSGTVLFESGTPDANGWLVTDAAHAGETCTTVSKAPAYDPAACYSPHVNVITASDQIAVYETVMADTNGHPTYILLYGNQIIKDNRIPPAGFTTSASTYNNDIAIIGDALADADFNKDGSGEGSGSDTVHYQLDWNGKPATGLQIEARLYYQSIRPAFISGLRNSGDKIDRFKWMVEQHKPSVELLASDQGSL